MASSLEHALEAGIADDGLSDKEAKLRAVKSSIQTHRRCASVSRLLAIKSTTHKITFFTAYRIQLA